ncbi:hypothetical protein CHH80_19570 [Bacillus sp. 7504-2]|nr:hypothetical protein CHH80_19570 [Bacillus sp. 7504-2]
MKLLKFITMLLVIICIMISFLKSHFGVLAFFFLGIFLLIRSKMEASKWGFLFSSLLCIFSLWFFITHVLSGKY